jgi:chromosomal replication initiator protein
LKALHEQTAHPVKIVFKTPEKENVNQNFPLLKEQVSSDDEIQYTFGNFVVGESNRLPYQAALQISNFTSPAYYNPCYIYSTYHGLGKTHLLKAIKNYIDRLKPYKSVCYISANDFAKTVCFFDQQNKINDLHNYFHSLDVILFDDIQALPSTPRPQDEFIFIINTLYDIKKQIVVSSDRPPRDMYNLEDKVRSRLSAGLIVEIGFPDFELKRRILNNKCLAENITLSDDVLSLFCSLNEFDINKLLHYIKRLVAICSIEKKPINVDLVKKMFDTDLLDPRKQIEKIQSTICQYFNLTHQQLLSQKKSHSLSMARQIAMHLARARTGLSFAKIGEIFGGRDHSTVVKAYSTIKGRLLLNHDLEHIINEINTLLRR